MFKYFQKAISLPFFPILVTPFLLYILPLLRGETLFWGLPALQFIPWRVFAWQLMSDGIIPLWNPYNGLGAPLIANYQLALFYPPGWLIYAANAVGGTPANAWMQTLLVPVHLAFCGVGMAMVGKKLELSVLAQTIMGLAFGLSGFFVARAGFYSMVWAGAWLPWIIYFASSFSIPINGRSLSTRIIFPGLIFSISMQLLSGHAQLSWYSLVLAGGWVIVGGWMNAGWKGAFRSFGVYSLSGVIAVSLAAVQLIPTGEYLLQSQRSSAVDAELGLTYSFWPWRFLTLLSPGFFGNPSGGNYWGYASYWEDALYIGVLPVFLAFTTLARLFNKSNSLLYKPLIRFCWVAILIASLLALGNNTPVFPWLYQHVPTFSLFNAPARWMFWSVFCLSILAGLGASAWSRPVGRAMRRYKRLTAASLAITIGAIAAWIGLSSIQATFIEAAAMIGIWATGVCLLAIFIPTEFEGKTCWMWLAVIWVILDLVWAGWNGQPFIASSYFAEPSGFNSHGSSDRVFMNSADEYAIKFHRFFRFSDYRTIEDWDNLRLAGLPNLNLLEKQPINLINNFDPFVPGRFAKWMEMINALPQDQQIPFLSLMNVGSQLARDVNQPIVGKIAQTDPGSRVWWSACAQWVRDDEKALKEVSDQYGKQLYPKTNILILEGTAKQENRDCVADNSWGARIVKEQPNQIEINAESNQDGFLFLGDTWFPGWSATVDEQPVEIFHANYLFRAIEMRAGNHTIIFNYSPKSFYIGAGISICMLSFMILWMLLLRHRVK